MRLAPGARAVHRLLTESMWVTLNQILFSVASVLATAFVARTASVHDAATVFAVYAVESIVITSCRGFLITAPLLRHRGATLCAGDMLEAFRMLALIGLAALVPYVILGFWLSHSWSTAGIAALWASAMFLADIVRQAAVAFSRRALSTIAVGVYLAGVLGAQLVGDDIGFQAYLARVAALSLLLAVALWVLVGRQGERGSCGFWRKERAFAGSQAAEGAGAVSMVSVTFLALARLAPTEMVGLQVASQALIGPALVIANGFSIPFTRRAAVRQQTGRSDVKVLAAWAAVLVLCMGAASAASTLATSFFVRFFGSAWYAAEPLVPALAVQAVIFVGSQIAMTRYRSLLRPAVLRRFWLLLVGVGYGSILLGVLFWGPGALEGAIWASNGLMLLLAGGALLFFERQARVALASQAS